MVSFKKLNLFQINRLQVFNSGVVANVEVQINTLNG
jgi:hypothetical protein